MTKGRRGLAWTILVWGYATTVAFMLGMATSEWRWARKRERVLTEYTRLGAELREVLMSLEKSR